MRSTSVTQFAQFLAIFFLGSIFSSCQLVTDGDVVNEKNVFETEKPPYSISSVTDQRVIQLVHTYHEENPHQMGLSDGIRSKSIEFDLGSLEYVVLDGQTRGAVFAKPKDYMSESSAQYALGFFLDDDRVSGSILSKTEKALSGIVTVSYFNVDGSLLQEVTIDPMNQTLRFKYSNMQKWSMTSTSCDPNEVLVCINTMYTGLGWGSLAWLFGSVFPPTAAGWAIGTIAGCTYVVCVQSN